MLNSPLHHRRELRTPCVTLLELGGARQSALAQRRATRSASIWKSCSYDYDGAWRSLARSAMGARVVRRRQQIQGALGWGT